MAAAPASKRVNAARSSDPGGDERCTTAGCAGLAPADGLAVDPESGWLPVLAPISDVPRQEVLWPGRRQAAARAPTFASAGLGVDDGLDGPRARDGCQGIAEAAEREAVGDDPVGAHPSGP